MKAKYKKIRQIFVKKVDTTKQYISCL